VRFDSTGTVTYDSWGASGGTTGYGILSNPSYWVNGIWVGLGASGLEEINGDALGVSTTDFPYGLAVVQVTVMDIDTQSWRRW